MRVKTIKSFIDLKEKKIRKEKEEFEVTKERFKEINSTSHGKLVEEIKEIKEAKNNG